MRLHRAVIKPSLTSYIVSAKLFRPRLGSSFFHLAVRTKNHETELASRMCIFCLETRLAKLYPRLKDYLTDWRSRYNAFGGECLAYSIFLILRDSRNSGTFTLFNRHCRKGNFSSLDKYF